MIDRNSVRFRPKFRPEPKFRFRFRQALCFRFRPKFRFKSRPKLGSKVNWNFGNFGNFGNLWLFWGNFFFEIKKEAFWVWLFSMYFQNRYLNNIVYTVYIFDAISVHFRFRFRFLFRFRFRSNFGTGFGLNIINLVSVWFRFRLIYRFRSITSQNSLVSGEIRGGPVK